MKAISLKQPWADAVMFLGKDIENRSWKTNHRGNLVIHCSKGWDKAGEDFIRDLFPNWTSDRAKEMRGGFFGIMWVREIVLCSPTLQTKNPWAFGPWCWLLTPSATVVLKNPIKGIGKLSLFDAPGIYELDTK